MISGKRKFVGETENISTAFTKETKLYTNHTIGYDVLVCKLIKFPIFLIHPTKKSMSKIRNQITVTLMLTVLALVVLTATTFAAGGFRVYVENIHRYTTIGEIWEEYDQLSSATVTRKQFETLDSFNMRKKVLTERFDRFLENQYTATLSRVGKLNWEASTVCFTVDFQGPVVRDRAGATPSNVVSIVLSPDPDTARLLSTFDSKIVINFTLTKERTIQISHIELTHGDDVLYSGG